MASFSTDQLRFFIHHLFLPPRLPQSNDQSPCLDDALIRLVQEAVNSFEKHANIEQRPVVLGVGAAIGQLAASRDSNGAIDAEKAGEALRKLADSCSVQPHVLPLYVEEQNAGVIVSKHADGVVFEAFELAPLNNAAMSTIGRLRRCFPGPAVNISSSEFADPDCRSTLAKALSTMSFQTAIGMRPNVRKAGKENEEIRDTTHPGLVTKLIPCYLSPFSRAIHVLRIWKNTREEVLWHSTLLPWRRSPLWLFIRVVLQLLFSRSQASETGQSTGNHVYKLTMAHLLATVLEKCLLLGPLVEPDVLLCMSAKITRRLLKLGPLGEGPDTLYVKGVLEQTSLCIQQRWKAVQQNNKKILDLSPLMKLDFEADNTLLLPELDQFLSGMSGREHQRDTSNFAPPLELQKLNKNTLSTTSIWTAGDYKVYNLMAWERWVACCLQSWSNNNRTSAGTCATLHNLMRNYHSAAHSIYKHNPEAVSLMILTLLELWVACDESAVTQTPYLQDYDPGIPLKHLQSLVLPLKDHMARLLRVEMHIERRRSNATYGTPGSIFTDFGTKTSLSVRFFNQSRKHQDLKWRIEKDALHERQMKCEELSRKKKEHQYLMQQVNSRNCEYRLVKTGWGTGNHHHHDCKRCMFLSQAQGIQIKVHEWPLPRKDLEAKSVVFELQAPAVFCHWRDATMFLIQNVLESCYDSKNYPQFQHLLSSYDALRQYSEESGSSRISLLSETKSHVVTHWSTKFDIPNTTEDMVCLNNGFQFHYFDSALQCFASGFTHTDTVVKLNTYELPQRCSGLQDFLFRKFDGTDRTANQVISTQSECPEHISLAEYRHLASIPIGYRLQWKNILVQLACPSIDLKKPEATLIIFQAMYQTGPKEIDDFRRAGHITLADIDFTKSLMSAVQDAAKRIEENWESFPALRVLVSVIVRQLSLVQSTDLNGLPLELLSLLGYLRDLAFRWMRKVKKKHEDATDDVQRASFLEKVVDIAVICSGTFDVDDYYLDTVFSNIRNTSIFMQCAIMIHDYYPEGSDPTQGKLKLILYQRWQRLSYRAYPVLAKTTVQRHVSTGLDDAIVACWPDYRRGSDWQTVSTEVDYWVVSDTDGRLGGQSLKVHYNMLTGQLLVNGLPLSRLPADYEHHPSYRELFGDTIFEIVPSSVPGLCFSSKRVYHKHVLHFGFVAPNLLVRAETTTENHAFELIPKSVFAGKLPEILVHKYFHWLDISKGALEFRDKSNPWDPNEATWRLNRYGPRWMLTRKGNTLVDPFSTTGKALSSIFQPLQQPLQIKLEHTSNGQMLQIELPMLQLDFSLKKGSSSVVSRQHRALEIDCQQYTDTLVGLKTKIVLKNPSNDDRRILVPAGEVTCARNGDHVEVMIQPVPRAAQVYVVDEMLQKLADNGTLQSKLYLCYLHGLTSFCLPDPLTSRTGTEQALSILQSSAVWSFQLLTKQDMEILRLIESLTTRRQYYPKHIKDMQTVIWNKNLPALSEHPHFVREVRKLFKHYSLARLYHPNEYMKPYKIVGVDAILSTRDSSRSSTFRISGFGAEDFMPTSDVTYKSRDSGQSSRRASQVQIISEMLFHREPLLRLQPCSSGHLWKVLESATTVQGRDNQDISPSIFGYDSRWLQNHPEHWAEMWCWMHHQAAQDNSANKIGQFQLMMWFSTMAFASKADLDMLHTAAAMFVLPEMRAIEPPPMTSFSLQEGASFSSSRANCLAKARSLKVIPSLSEFRIEKFPGEDDWDHVCRRERAYEKNQQEAVDQLVSDLYRQFPSPEPVRPTGAKSVDISKYVSIEKAMSSIKPIYRTWYENWLFKEYLKKIETLMHRTAVKNFDIQAPCFTAPHYSRTDTKTFVTPNDFFSLGPPEMLPEGTRLPAKQVMSASPLGSLVERVALRASSKYEHRYAAELRNSLEKLQPRSIRGKTLVDQCSHDKLCGLLQDHLEASQRHSQLLLQTILASLRQSLGNQCFTESCHLSPRLSPGFLLQTLAINAPSHGLGWEGLPEAWKPWIIAYCLSLTEVQRATRLLQSVGNDIDFAREVENEGHGNWNPGDHPEYLLLEVESRIMIRDVQQDIAEQMSYPPNMSNAVMQLNMGEGKSSVIAPMVTLTLADRTRLVRVIVAKPQSRQMLHMLVSKLGGLLNRRIYHLPFSRALRMSLTDAAAIAKQCQRCMDTRGVMLVQPEHLLSFKLMGLECMSTGKQDLGRSMLQIQHFFNTSSRDVVDESDENFSVRFELIYTMGLQTPIEFAQGRWIVIQTVLDFVRKHADEVKRAFPLSIEVHGCPAGGFPRIRLLRGDASSMLLEHVALDICTHGFPGFPISRQNVSSRRAVLKYITAYDLSSEDIETVERGPFWTDTTTSHILLLRGLFAGGILAFAFGHKRWRVNYGLDTTRDPPTRLAVPYRAKDSPTPRSEFSHPDVVIALTCNCYYYGGLDDDDLFLAFESLVLSDQADAEYQEWVRDSSGLPQAFRQLMGVNLKDAFQCKEEVFPAFRYAKRAIDYFLQVVVFPKQMKEFPKKLSASGWDLGEVKTQPTTGFSGTIDSRMALPMDVSHLDLPDQQQTNALVLSDLLRPENGVILMPSRADSPTEAPCQNGDIGALSDGEELLRIVLGQDDPNLRVILDVGAQILELTNAQVAKKWLEMAHAKDDSIQAALYFNDDEEIMVADVRGLVEPFRTSPYAEQLDACLVFLDESHTRGTDLRLPANYRAAVTVGANLTKDRLVQACMRMRKLGKGQSVVFCIPQEIQTKIHEAEGCQDSTADSTEYGEIGVPEVLNWAIDETFKDIRKSMPLWSVQGHRYERQRSIWAEASSQDGIDMAPAQAERFLEDEAETLEQRYRPRPPDAPSSADADVHAQEPRLRAIADRCAQVLGASRHMDEASLQEEQERELSPEIEEERQVERPGPAEPAPHSIHKDLRTFVSTGVLAAHSPACMPAFASLADTRAAAYLDISLFPRDILVTADFARTVKRAAGVSGAACRFESDAYLRPVQWILTSQPASWDHVVIISPYEAHELLDEIMRSRRTTLHVYSPRPNEAIRPLDALDLYTVPSRPRPRRDSFPVRLAAQLNLFSGQLYFGSRAEYVELCRLLRLSWQEAAEGTVLTADGFITSSTVAATAEIVRTSSMTQSPVKFLKEFLTRARRDCQSIDKTHLGRMLNNALLSETDFESSVPEVR